MSTSVFRGDYPGTEYSWAKRAAGIDYIGIDHLMLLTLFGK